jgi:hypothetical protein
MGLMDRQSNALLTAQAEKMLEFYDTIQRTNITTQKNQSELSERFTIIEQKINAIMIELGMIKQNETKKIEIKK